MDEIIEKTIYIEPKFLDSNILSHIKDKLKSTFDNKCSKESGYIISVKNIVEIINIRDTVFSVKFAVETYKPENNQVVEGDIKAITKDGIFIKVKDIQQVFIPFTMLKGYKYDADNNTFIKGKSAFNLHDSVKAKIMAVRYNITTDLFDCVGCLV